MTGDKHRAVLEHKNTDVFMKAILFSLTLLISPSPSKPRSYFFLHSLSLSLFFFFFRPRGMYKFLGQGLNPFHSSNPSRCSDSARSLTHCTTREHLSLALLVSPSGSHATAKRTIPEQAWLEHRNKPLLQPESANQMALRKQARPKQKPPSQS